MRNSSFEFIRIIAIFGIIIMHSVGEYMQVLTGLELVLGTLINVVFNLGVTYFALLSGYFGIKNPDNKLIKIWWIMVFYSILYTILSNQNELNLKSLIIACMPISRNIHWYLCGYSLLLVFLCLFENCNFSKNNYEKFIVLVTILFYLIPTIQRRTTISASDGKEFIYIFILYFIGRYIGLYKKDNKVKRAAPVFVLCLLITFSLNLFLSIYDNKGTGVRIDFCKDCSIFILIMGIALIIMIREWNFYNKGINFLSKCVLGICMGEGCARIIFPFQLLEGVLLEKVGRILTAVLYSIIVFIIAAMIEIIRYLLSESCKKYLFPKFNIKLRKH